MQKLPMSRIGELFSAIDEKKELYLPVAKTGRVNFDRWRADAKVKLNALNTTKSPKDLFFPQSEDLVSFKMEGKNIEVLPPAEPSTPFVLFGVRPCDVKSIEILDLVFLSDPVDTYYQARRENGVIVGLACNEPEETCFCDTFEVDATQPKGDVAAWIANDNLYWKPLTEKGEELTKLVAGLMEDAEESEIKEQTEVTKAILNKLPLKNLNVAAFGGDKTEQYFESPQWEQLSKACIGCGTCTFVCPTCQCYDIRDFDTGKGVQRYRCWDSCMYSDFTRMAHGNPRKTQVERFRQRFMHKLVYFPANNDGEFSCVGCGRCVAKCPISMNIVKVIKTLGANEDEQ